MHCLLCTVCRCLGNFCGFNLRLRVYLATDESREEFDRTAALKAEPNGAHICNATPPITFISELLSPPGLRWGGFPVLLRTVATPCRAGGVRAAAGAGKPRARFPDARLLCEVEPRQMERGTGDAACSLAGPSASTRQLLSVSLGHRTRIRDASCVASSLQYVQARRCRIGVVTCRTRRPRGWLVP